MQERNLGMDHGQVPDTDDFHHGEPPGPADGERDERMEPWQCPGCDIRPSRLKTE